MDLEGMVLSEMSEKDKRHMISFTHGMYNKRKPGKVVRCVVTSGYEGGEVGGRWPKDTNFSLLRNDY